jgi:hypothetical protein
MIMHQIYINIFSKVECYCKWGSRTTPQTNGKNMYKWVSWGPFVRELKDTASKCRRGTYIIMEREHNKREAGKGMN